MENNIVTMNGTPNAGAASAAPVTNGGSTLHDVRSNTGAFYIGTFDGKERYIKFDLNAFAEMEDMFGSMEAAQERLQGGSMKDVRTVLWLGLIWNEAVVDEITGEPIRYTLSQYQVGSWLNTLNMKEVMAKLQEAITGSLPTEEASAQAVNNAAAQAANDPN